jgi:hypothetical protein
MFPQPSPVLDDDWRLNTLNHWRVIALADAGRHKVFAITLGAEDRVVVAPPPLYGASRVKLILRDVVVSG